MVLPVSLSYRDARDLLAEGEIAVDAATVYRWVQKFGPEIRKRAYDQHRSWRVIKKGHFANIQPGVLNEIAFVEGLFQNAA